MKTIVKIFMIALLGVSLLQGAAFEKVAKSRATKVTLNSEKPLTAGNNTIILKISNDKLKDSKVVFKAFMPAMPGMPAMESKSEAKNLGNGKYSVDFNLAMNGTWQVHIFITPKEGRKVRVKTSLNI